MKLTEKHIDDRIDTVTYQHVPGTTTTVCTIKLVNGFVLLGQSACIDAADFDEQVGKDIAYKKARDKIWELEGYLACEAKYKALQLSEKRTEDLAMAILLKRDASTPFFQQNVEKISTSEKINRLWRTPLHLFSQEEKQVISDYWNALEGHAEEGRIISQSLLNHVLEIYDRHFVGGK